MQRSSAEVAAPRVMRSDSDAPQLIERVLAPFQRFAQTESSSGLVLLACTAIALVWANSPWAASYEHLWETELTLSLGPWSGRMTLHHLINDGLMAVFFFLVGLEIKREMLAGELASARQAALPIAGALGGMIVPALVYASLNAGTSGEPGWGVPMATDIAFALGVLALLGDRVPVGVRVFLAALAIVDDIGAVLVIAVFYSGGIALGPLSFAGALVLLALGANLAGVRRPWAYAAIGLVLWGAVISSGIHATIAGVLLAMTIPARTRIDEARFLSRARSALSRFETAHEPGASPLNDPEHQAAVQQLERLAEQLQPPLLRLEHALHGIVAFGIMPLFALANAGVPLGLGGLGGGDGRAVALGVALGLLVGKPVGITLLAWAAVRFGLASLPQAVTWRSIAGAGLLGGIGFTMALFIAALAFSGEPELLVSAKLGILGASLIAGLAGWLVLRGSRPAAA
ncbi:MAG TPA: Na+/H+ antiporter NhaA [Gemmatimonadales bacterium]|nr:Na+/H+ antiporter NhaA [Gemmatimonadales bacterium]